MKLISLHRAYRTTGHRGDNYFLKPHRDSKATEGRRWPTALSEAKIIAPDRSGRRRSRQKHPGANSLSRRRHPLLRERQFGTSPNTRLSATTSRAGVDVPSSSLSIAFSARTTPRSCSGLGHRPPARQPPAPDSNRQLSFAWAYGLGKRSVRDERIASPPMKEPIRMSCFNRTTFTPVSD